jgi:hypothetical protein
VKILYAAPNNFHGKIQAERVLDNLKDHQVKVAAYRASMPDSGMDWCLDPLLFPRKNNPFAFLENRYLEVYQDQVKSFDPDLIISDMEFYTSYVALNLNKRLWHVSNRLYNFSIDELFKKHINVFKYYKDVYESKQTLMIINELIAGADRNYLYSHFCDIDEKIILKNKFEWMRPYYISGKVSEVARHNYVGVDTGNYSLINLLSEKKGDKVVFSRDRAEYSNLICKDYRDKLEYSCNVRNCDYYVCDGTASFLADAFYNERRVILFQDHKSIESLFNYMLYYQIYRYLVEEDFILPAVPSLDSSVRFLHERIQEIL